MWRWLRRLFSTLETIDGDTIRQTNGRLGRIFGIDAPELSQPGGEESRLYLDYLIRTAGKVQFIPHGETSYKRDVGSLMCGDVDLAKLMVRGGWAYDSPTYSKGRYALDEAYARKHNLGLWAEDIRREKPWTYRKSKKKPRRF